MMTLQKQEESQICHSIADVRALPGAACTIPGWYIGGGSWHAVLCLASRVVSVGDAAVPTVVQQYSTHHLALP